MYCSVKFLSPIVTGGLPTPGPDDALVEVPELDLPAELDDELPQAASATTRASPAIPANTFFMLLLLLVVNHRAPVSVTTGAIVSAGSFAPASFNPRGVSRRCRPASANSTASARPAMQIAAPSTPDR